MPSTSCTSGIATDCSGTVAAFGVIWLSYAAEQTWRHALPIVMTWAAWLLAVISAIWWTSQ
jgi:hypothetical protein